jgi:hypothetical protein
MVPRHQARTHGDSFALISPRPPTHRRAAARSGHRGQQVRRARPASDQGGRMPGRRPRTAAADSWSRDQGVSSLRLAPWAPVRPRRAGRPVAQGLTKRLPSKTSLVCSRW